MEIDLVYFEGCANVDGMRERLRDSLQRIGAPMLWREWNTLDGTAPARFLGYASPAVFVNDVAVETAPIDGSRAACAIGGGPSVDALVAAMQCAGR